MRSGQFAERAGAWEYLNKAKTEGLVRAIGVSTHNVDVVREMASVDECDVVFPLVNYAGLGIRNGEGPGTADEMMEAISACHDAGKGIFSMKVFRRRKSHGDLSEGAGLCVFKEDSRLL